VAPEQRPEWLESLASQMVEQLSVRLSEIAQTQLRPQPFAGRTLTTYDILHWAGPRLDSICPIEKS
jgi:hypothetical protein